MTRSVLFLLCLSVFISVGCARKVDLGPGYEHVSKRFLEAMRWQDYRGAAAAMQGEHRAALVEMFEEYHKDLNVVDAEYLFSRLDKKTGTASSELVFTYYLLPSTQVKEWRWKMDWILLPVDTKQAGTWQVQGAPPSFP